MAGLGVDIAEVFTELGSTVEVYKHATGETYTEYIDSEQDTTRSSPFDSHFMKICSFPYNTNAAPGDRISFTDYDPVDRFLLVSQAPEVFEKEIISKEGILYKCNAIVEFKRKVEVRNPVTYALSHEWQTQYSGEYVLFTGQLSDMRMSDERYGTTIIDKNLMYVSADIEIETADRCVVSTSFNVVSGEIISGEMYSIDYFEEHRLPGIKICRVSEDTRG
jgi:hypothetical protein